MLPQPVSKRHSMANLPARGKKETSFIVQVLHHGLGPSKITKEAARKRLVEATKEGKSKVPQPIVDTEKRLREDYRKRLGTEQRFRGGHKEPATDVSQPATGLNTDCACKGVSEWSWYEDYEAAR